MKPSSKTKNLILYGNFIDTPKLGKLRIRTETILLIINGIIEEIEDDVCDIDTRITDIKSRYNNIFFEIIDISKKHSNGSVQFFFPGFIDTHCHAPQYPNIGIFGNTTLLNWLEKYTFPLEKELSDDLIKAESVYKKVIEKTLQNGTTTISYYATINRSSTVLLAKLCLELGQRAFVGKVCMDMNAPGYYSESHEQCIQENIKVISDIRSLDSKAGGNKMVEPILTPRFAPMVSKKTMYELGKISKYQCVPIQTHLSESFNEIEMVKSIFPESRDYTSVYYDNNLLNERTVLAHCIHLSEDEAKMISDSKAGVSHCPVSNSSITSGECRVRWLLDKGIKVSLGTDMSGGYSPSILKTARQGLLVSRHIAMKTSDEVGDKDKLSTNEVLFLATVGGAEVMNLEKTVGKFNVGMSFDAQLIEVGCGTNVDVFDWQIPSNSDAKEVITEKWQDLVDKWVFLGDDRETTKVWVNGNQVK
ncbi:hypothetical protein QEN19_002276 [Hanseniaspora menglaensis]